MKNNICIVGLGYVGLPLAIEFAKFFEVLGFDENINRINQLKKMIEDSLNCVSDDWENRVKWISELENLTK